MNNNVKLGLKREGSPYTDQECEQIIAKLEQMLDGELDVEREKNFIEMVNGCEYCLEQYNIEKSIRKLVKSGLKNLQISANLISTIKSKIRQTQDNRTNNQV